MMTDKTDTPGEALGDGVIIDLDRDNDVIRIKMWGEWNLLSPERARGLADHLMNQPIPVAPEAYDVHGHSIGSCVERLREYANAIESSKDNIGP